MGEIRTKDEPKNAKSQNMRFIKIDFLFPSLVPCLIPPTDEREKSGRTTTELPVTPKYVLLRFPSSLNSIQQAHCAVH